jgi:hypothetical protein
MIRKFKQIHAKWLRDLSLQFFSIDYLNLIIYECGRGKLVPVFVGEM